ncbi:MAG: hypothetical protein ABT01_00785 [Clostridium sp. SCN 57-10]|nr:MAG: hypothetical protein ABT01_00785 [Clostridium sp. SCN 57-10]
MKEKRVILMALAIALILFSGCVRDGADVPPDTAAPQAEISLEQEVIDTLCTPEMRGRLVGSAENLAAGEYIASVFADLGLAPLLGSSVAVPYEQDIVNVEQAEPQLTAHFADGSSRALVFGSEFSFSLAEGAIGRVDLHRCGDWRNTSSAAGISRQSSQSRLCGDVQHKRKGK